MTPPTIREKNLSELDELIAWLDKEFEGDMNKLGGLRSIRLHEIREALVALKARDDEANKLKEEFQQLVMEVSHAMESGSQWYTRGEEGLRSHIRARIERARAALAAHDQSVEKAEV